MKQKDKYIIIIIIFTVAIISIVSIFKVLVIIQNIKGNPKNIIYIGKPIDNTSYEVYLKDNDFIDEKILSHNYSYVTSLIESIKIKYDYLFSIDRNTNLSYNYYIEASIVGLFNASNQSVINPVLNKKNILKEKSEIKEVSNDAAIKEDISIDVNSYNFILEEFVSTYNLPVEASLNIKLVVDYSGKEKNKTLNNEHSITVSIPLGVKAFDITLSHSFTDEEIVYFNEKPDKEKSFVQVILYILITSFFLILGSYLIKKITYKYKSKFITTVEKILKEYDDRIVEVTNFVKYEKWETVDVESFDELIDLSNEAFEPIFYYKRRYNRNTEAWFCILRDKVLYRFRLYKKET